MAMIAGSVSITLNMSDGNPLVSGTGLALQLGQARLLALMATSFAGMFPLPTVGQKTAPFFPSAPATAAMIATRVKNANIILAGVQAQANADATTIVDYFQANATANIASGTSLDLVVPTPNTAGTAIAAAGTTVNLPIT